MVSVTHRDFIYVQISLCTVNWVRQQKVMYWGLWIVSIILPSFLFPTPFHCIQSMRWSFWVWLQWGIVSIIWTPSPGPPALPPLFNSHHPSIVFQVCADSSYTSSLSLHIVATMSSSYLFFTCSVAIEYCKVSSFGNVLLFVFETDI